MHDDVRTEIRVKERREVKKQRTERIGQRGRNREAESRQAETKKQRADRQRTERQKQRSRGQIGRE